MSRIHRIVEKAEREGRLTLTRGAEAPPPSYTAPLGEADGDANEVTPGALPPAWRPDDPEEAAGPAGEPDCDEFAPRPPGIDPILVAATEPGSMAAEQYRLLRTRLEGSEEGRRAQVLLVTSPRLGDGKTITSANLALTMAQDFQQKVLLVEADLRRPTLGPLLGLPDGPGLVDVLVGAASLDDALVQVPDRDLVVLTGGMPAARSTELLSSSMMQNVLASLRSRFDRIVVDTPPVEVADTHVLTRVCDGILLVVRAGQTPRPAVERALEGVDREKVLGLVLNEVEETADAYSYRYQDSLPQAVGE